MGLNSTELVATCPGGLEDVLRREIISLGWSVRKFGNGAVHFQGPGPLVERANLSLRTASRVLVPLISGRVSSYDDVYRLAGRIDWPSFAPPTDSIAVFATTSSKLLPDTRFLALRVKDAVVDVQRRRTGRRSRVDRRYPRIGIVVHADDEHTQISLDSSGRPLHMRGYRLSAGPAPLRENVAAAIVLMSGWSPNQALIDPFCGSGTIVIEAAMIRRHIPPGGRRDFAFLGWPGADRAQFDSVRAKLLSGITEPDTGIPPIIGSDSSAEMIDVAGRNAERAGVREDVTITVRDFFSTRPPIHGPAPQAVQDLPTLGPIVTNPPYGERMELEDAGRFYRMVGDHLKQNYAGHTVWMLSANRKAMKSIGLRVSARIPLYNGGLDSRLYRIDLYDDSGSQE